MKIKEKKRIRATRQMWNSGEKTKKNKKLGKQRKEDSQKSNNEEQLVQCVQNMHCIDFFQCFLLNDKLFYWKTKLVVFFVEYNWQSIKKKSKKRLQVVITAI